MTRHFAAFVAAIALALLASACGGSSGGPPPSSSATPTQATAPTPTATPGVAAAAFVLTIDASFQVGNFGAISLDEPRQIRPVDSRRREVHSDAAARAFDGIVYVANRFGADNILALDPAQDFDVLFQCSTGGGSNPNDIAFASAEKAYVALLNRAELMIVNPSTPPDCSEFEIGTIDLSAFADADGVPETSQMAVVGDFLYVALQRLDRDNFLTPIDGVNGAIAVIDTRTDEVVDDIALTGQNPFATTKGLTVVDGALVVAEAGHFGVLDGGIERIDLGSKEPQGYFITEADLGGDLSDFALVSDRLGYAIVTDSSFANSLVAFDPESGEVGDTVLSTPGFFIADVELNDRGELFVADRTPELPGVRIYRASDGIELTDEPLDLGLPPFEIVFLP